MFTMRPREERGEAPMGGSRRATRFSFADSHDPADEGSRALRVIVG
jgi:hypothetical protein